MLFESGCVTFFVLSAISRLPDPWWMLGFFAWMPLVPVQGTINALAAQRGVQPNDTVEAKHIVVMVIGGLMFAMLALGMVAAMMGGMS